MTKKCSPGGSSTKKCSDRREFAIAAALIIAWIVVINVLAACSRPPARMPAERADEVRQGATNCMVGVAVIGDHETDLELCASIAEVCDWFYEQAVNMGYPVLSVGPCIHQDRRAMDTNNK